MEKPNRWHALAVEEVLQQLGTSLEGLATRDVGAVRRQAGTNRLPPPRTRSQARMFIDQFRSALIYILLIAAIVAMVLREWPDAVVILFVVLLNAIVGYRQEYQSNAAVTRLLQLSPQIAHVIRDGLERETGADELVVGDIVVVTSGDTVPADGRWIQALNLRIVEAPLSGELVPVSKQTDPVPLETPLGERQNMAWRGTNVAAGRGQFVVTAVGLETRFGNMVAEIELDGRETTPLEQTLAAFSRRLAVATLGLGAIVFLLGLYRGRELEEIFLLAISMIVSIIPEGLPVVITMAMAWGMWEMAKRQAYVRKLSAVETLGAVTVVATDKTGTLTYGEMMVEKLWVNHQSFHFTGQGYAPLGDITLADQPILGREYEGLSWALRLGAMNNDGRFSLSEAGQRQAIGDPTELALIVAAGKAGWSKHDLDMVHARLGEFPFDYQKKYMVTWHWHNPRETLVVLKGAPREVLAICNRIWITGGERALADRDRATCMEIYERWAAEGLRGLLVAYAVIPTQAQLQIEKTFGRFTAVGLFGMADALRPEAPAAIQSMQRAGIRVLMLTGDYQPTGISIAQRLGLLKGLPREQLLDGGDVDRLDDPALRARLAQARVGTRLTPDHKFRIAKLLKQNHEIVAMTGDGINDVPALTEANVGIAVGQTASDAAKEAADIVLVDGNFSSITAAIAEGRRIFRNIRRVMFYLLASNFGELLLVMLTLVVGLPLPLLPKQIIWLNAITDPFLGVALAREPPSPNVMRERPHDPTMPLVDQAMWKRISLTSAALGFGALMIFLWAHASGRTTPQIYALTLTTLALGQWLTALNARSTLRSIFSSYAANRSLLTAFATVIGMQILILYVPGLNRLFEVAPLSVMDWALVILAASPVVAADEIRKWWLRSRYHPATANV